ncbi:glycoside-pentoside-hexuronide (GPH):cation symporter [Paraburkholderia sp. RL17-337-BIB-A]|uniref:glycoside-pentoside-hexuronide (GPH):cation symporter n=1 Tax=Paraburkholderia sp. RL17-337-BIB-A TaxID=3031636 RepID=UPI0038BE173A
MNKKMWPSVITYGAGEVGNNFIYAMGAMFLLNYYTDVAGIPAVGVGTMLLAIRIFDAVADIWAGRVVDRTSTRWGRFRPYLLWLALPLAVANVLVFSVPAHWGAGAKLAYAYCSYGFLGALFSFVSIPYGSLATAISQDSGVRAMLGVSREVIASFTAIFLAIVIAPRIHHAAHGGGSLHDMYTRYVTIFGLIGVLFYAICFKGTKEVVTRRREVQSLGNSLRTILRNRALMFICFAQVCIMAAYFSMNATIIYFARYVLDNPEMIVAIVVARKLLGMLVSISLTQWLVKLSGRKGVFIAGLCVYISGFIALYFVRTTNAYAIFALFSLISVGQVLVSSMAFALQADTVEYGEYVSGERLEGMSYAFFSFSRKCGQALGGAVPAFVLAASGYVPNASHQTPQSIAGIYSALTLVPAGLLAVTLAIFLFYPLTEHRFSEILAEINARRARTNGTLSAGEELAPTSSCDVLH